MVKSFPSALVIDQGTKVLLRLYGHCYQLTQNELRKLLALPKGPPGVGITIDRCRFHFEFAGDDRTAKVTAAQLHRRLLKHASA